MTYPVVRTLLRNVPGRTGSQHTTTLAAVVLLWTPTDALRCDLTLLPHPTSTPTRWTLARDLLAAGLDGPAGLGDLTIFPDLADHNYLQLVLRDRRGIGHNLALTIARDPLRRFLDRTIAEVPIGAETLEIDAARLTGGAR